MKILIDGYWWYRGPFSNRMVLLEIVKQWKASFPDDELVIAAPAHPERGHPETATAEPAITRTHLRLHPLINSIELPMIARRESADAILAFNFAALSKRGAVFLHDVLFQSNPEWFTAVERAYFSAMPRLAKRAASVIATSATEQQRITTFNPALHRVVPCGLTVSSTLAKATPQRPELRLSDDSFIVCVGRFNKRKNLETTVRALLEAGVLSESFPLVLIGEASGAPSDLTEFDHAIAEKSIVTANNVPDNVLKWLYTHCRLFVCLSLDEGFGLPVVEAATFGAPVLASDIPIFRETLGSYGTLVDPTNVEEIAAAAKLMVSTPREKSVPYSDPHSWHSVCQNIRDELVRLR